MLISIFQLLCTFAYVCARVRVCVRCVSAHTYIILLLVSPARQVPKPVYHRQTRFLNRFASSALRVERPLVALALPWSPKSVPSQLPVISGVIIVVRAWLKYFLHELPVSRYSLPRNQSKPIKRPNCVCVRVRHKENFDEAKEEIKSNNKRKKAKICQSVDKIYEFRQSSNESRVHRSEMILFFLWN